MMPIPGARMPFLRPVLFSCLASLSLLASPLVVAHRGGAADAPENTLAAIREALGNGADMLWLSVQVTRDGTAVLYRPADLSAQTQGRGAVADHTLAELRGLNAGWRFEAPKGSGLHPFRNHPVGVPTLAEALAAIPAAVPVLLDLKAPRSEPLVQAVGEVLERLGAWDRVRLYATQTGPLALMRRAFPRARVFEERDQTRNRLVRLRLGGGCGDPPAEGAWLGFELQRMLTVSERFTLGEGRSEVPARLWDKAAMACLRTRPGVVIVLFGVETAEDLACAEALGVDAVMTDSPRSLRALRRALPAVGRSALPPQERGAMLSP